MKRLTVDSSIIVSSLLENEPRHKEALKIWNSALSGKNVAIIPYSVFVRLWLLSAEEPVPRNWRDRLQNNYWKLKLFSLWAWTANPYRNQPN